MTLVTMSLGTSRRKCTVQASKNVSKSRQQKTERRVIVLYKTHGSVATHLKCSGILVIVSL